MALVLGRAPEPLVIQLTPGADFTARLAMRDAGTESAWPEGTTLRLTIHSRPQAEEHSWDFTINGATATLVIPDDVVDTLISQVSGKSRARLWLTYPGTDAGGEFLWAAGEVQVRG